MIYIKLQDKERLLKTSRAARYKNIYGVSDKFFPTNQQLLFKSLLFSCITRALSIPQYRKYIHVIKKAETTPF